MSGKAIKWTVYVERQWGLERLGYVKARDEATAMTLGKQKFSAATLVKPNSK